MAKWTWEVLVRTETTLKTESLPLRFIQLRSTNYGQVLPKVGRKSATASPNHKSLIVALLLNLGWSAPLLAIHCKQPFNFRICKLIFKQTNCKNSLIGMQ